MVKVQEKEEDAYEVLDALVRGACEREGLKLFVDGWTRKTYDIYREDKKDRKTRHLARVESLVTSTGEIRYFDEESLPFLQTLGTAVEQAFKLEVTLVFDRSPNA